ncbi:cell division protein FtsL [Aestuariibacter halophilus]|uniref:Cell division protein FtsL n=1 Tax=Fluctibacter halophilus TaxID=226011 RepID=A0ABS8G7C5_9ALTE|nr:cell division protein FtsL [Aestuariibacter halophilus]MCC2616445.1 cell division protein FtsL [Aestuariibacter halophilus]
MSERGSNFNLVLLILTELARHPVRVLLFLAVLASAAMVILTTHHNRQMAIALESTMQERDKLDVEWRHLILEQSALTEHNRIESLVKEQLDMHRPTPEEEIVVRVK